MDKLEVVHGPQCWGRTSYSEEVAHCYCKEPLTPLAPAEEWQARALAAEAQVERMRAPDEATIRAAMLALMDEDAKGKDPTDYFDKRDLARAERLRNNPDDPEWQEAYALTRRFLAALQEPKA